MKEYSQPKKIISISMTFILLINLSGCVSSKIISSAELPDSGKYVYIVHSKNLKYRLENTEVSNGILTGKINIESSHMNSVHLYLSSDSLLKIDTTKIVSIPIDSIIKVKISKFSAGRTALLVGAGIFTILLLVFPKNIMGDTIVLGHI